MTTDNTVRDEAWGKLVDKAESDREKEMLTRYALLAELPEADRQNRLLGMARSEYALPEAKLRDFTLSRMRVLLKMEPAAARRIAASYASVMERMPGADAIRRVTLVQTLAPEFSPEDEARLREMNATIFGGMPAKPDKSTIPSRPPEEPKQAKKKGMWPFGKK